MLTLALTIGVAVSILLTELTGLAAGGIIVPGYVAMILDRPRALLGLLALIGLTYAVMRLAADYFFLFGTRRFGVTVLVGLCFSTGAQAIGLGHMAAPLEWAGLGYIVPGLVAHHCERQGILQTLAMIAIAAPLVRLMTMAAVRWVN